MDLNLAGLGISILLLFLGVYAKKPRIWYYLGTVPFIAFYWWLMT
jgi:hypothetical protein